MQPSSDRREQALDRQRLQFVDLLYGADRAGAEEADACPPPSSTVMGSGPWSRAMTCRITRSTQTQPISGAGIPIAAIRIGNRVALAQAMALGLGVIENARIISAAAEISALAEEIRGALSG